MNKIKIVFCTEELISRKNVAMESRTGHYRVDISIYYRFLQINSYIPMK